MIHEREGTTFLKKLGANTRLWMALAVLVAVLAIQNYYLSIAIMIISYIEIIRNKMTGMFKFILIATFFMFVFQFLIYGTILTKEQDKTVLFYFFDTIPYYLYGFNKAVHFFFRIAPLMACLFLLIMSIEITDLGCVMTKGGIPYKAAFIFVDCFMTIKVLSKDMEQIMDAQKARGLVTEGNVITRMKAFVPVIVPVVANAISKVQDQAIAMDTKGFNSECKKSVYRTIPNNTADKIIKVLCWVIIVACLAYAILSAMGKIPPFLTNAALMK